MYWPGSGNITIKQNVYFGTTASLKREDEEALAMNSEQTVALGTPTSPPTTNLPNSSKMPAWTPADNDNDDNGDGEPEPKKKQVQPELQPTQLCQSTCNHRQLCPIQDLQSGEGITLARKGSPRVIISLQKPDPIAEEGKEGKEAGGVWVVINGTPELLEDFEDLEHVLLTETTDAKALESCTLTKAKKDAMGIIACFKARLVAQEFSQIGGIDYNDTCAPVA